MPQKDGLVLLDEEGKSVCTNDLVPGLPRSSFSQVGAASLGSEKSIPSALSKIATEKAAESIGQAHLVDGNGETTMAGFFRAALDGRFFEVDPILAKILGFATPGEFVTACADFRWQLYASAVRQAEFAQLTLQEGMRPGFEAELYTREGQTVWIDLFARTICNESGEPMSFEGWAIDKTARKRAEAALRQSEKRFRRLAETTSLVPFEFDLAAQTFTYIGAQGESLFGENFHQGLSLQGFSAMIHPEDLQEATRFAQELTWMEKSSLQAEFRICDVPGRGNVWIKQIAHRAAFSEKPNCVGGFLLEITTAKLSEEKRDQSRIHLRELAAHTQSIREEERMNVARELHDELGQALTLLRLDLSWMHGRISHVAKEEAIEPLREKIGSMEQLIHQTLQSMHRILASLRPPLLEELGLQEAIEFHLEGFSQRLSLDYEFESTALVPLPMATATAIFRIFQETLTNVARHAQASRIKVFLGLTENALVLRVHDDGCGVSQAALRHPKSFGLLGMQERAWAIGGELHIHGAPHAGTSVFLSVPLPLPTFSWTAEPSSIQNPLSKA